MRIFRALKLNPRVQEISKDCFIKEKFMKQLLEDNKELKKPVSKPKKQNLLFFRKLGQVCSTCPPGSWRIERVDVDERHGVLVYCGKLQNEELEEYAKVVRAHCSRVLHLKSKLKITFLQRMHELDECLDSIKI